MLFIFNELFYIELTLINDIVQCLRHCPEQIVIMKRFIYILLFCLLMQQLIYGY